MSRLIQALSKFKSIVAFPDKPPIVNLNLAIHFPVRPDKAESASTLDWLLVCSEAVVSKPNFFFVCIPSHTLLYFLNVSWVIPSSRGSTNPWRHEHWVSHKRWAIISAPFSLVLYIDANTNCCWMYWDNASLAWQLRRRAELARQFRRRFTLVSILPAWYVSFYHWAAFLCQRLRQKKTS